MKKYWNEKSKKLMTEEEMKKNAKGRGKQNKDLEEDADKEQDKELKNPDDEEPSEK